MLRVMGCDEYRGNLRFQAARMQLESHYSVCQGVNTSVCAEKKFSRNKAICGERYPRISKLLSVVTAVHFTVTIVQYE